MYNTLILNKYFVPIHIVHYRRAVSILYQNHGKALDNNFMQYTWENWLNYSVKPTTLDDGYHFLNTINYKVAVPDTIVLIGKNYIPRQDIQYTRENIFHRDKNICQYCGLKFKRDELTLDHILPKSLGGKNTWTNVVVCCKRCNNVKGNRTPAQAKMVLLRPPIEPKWYTPLGKIVDITKLRPTWYHFLKREEI